MIRILSPFFTIMALISCQSNDAIHKQKKQDSVIKLESDKDTSIHHISCSHYKEDQLITCYHTIEPNNKELNSIKKSCSEGKISESLCPLHDALGQCEVASPLKKENYFHYISKEIPNQLEKVKNNCLHNKGSWKKIDIEKELLKEAMELYRKRFDDKAPPKKEIENIQKGILSALSSHYTKFKNWFVEEEKKKEHQKTQLHWESLENLFSEFRKKHSNMRAEEALNDKSWYLPFIIDLSRITWIKLGLQGGGCGTLSTYLCTQELIGNVPVSEIDNYYQGNPGTSLFEATNFFESKGLCPIPPLAVLGDSCDSYKTMKSWKNLGCALELTMRANRQDSGHVEYVYEIFNVPELNFCYGMTNSWGTPAIALAS